MFGSSENSGVASGRGGGRSMSGMVKNGVSIVVNRGGFGDECSGMSVA